MLKKLASGELCGASMSSDAHTKGENGLDLSRPIVLTGGSGFIGACLTRRLVSEQRCVHLLLRPEAKLWRLRDVLNQVVVHACDIRNAPALTAILQTVKPTVLIHLATHGAYANQTSAREIIETNVVGTLNVLQAAIEAETRLVVNTGSSSEYGRKLHPMSESDRLDPNRVYGVAKAAQSHLSALFGRQYDSVTSVVTFRLFTVFGPWESPDRLVPQTVLRALASRPLEMSSPATARDFIYVDDVAEALLNFDRLLPHSGEIFNLGTGLQSQLANLVQCVLDCTGSVSQVHWSAIPQRSWDSDTWVADITKTESLLGWTHKYSLRSGVEKFVNWVRSSGESYGRV